MSGLNVSDQFDGELLQTLLAAGVPADIAQRVAAAGYDPLDDEKHSELLLSCFGRLQHLQTAGGAAARRAARNLMARDLAAPNAAIHDVTALAYNGFVRIPPLLSPSQISDCSRWFMARPCFNGHMPETAADNIGRFASRTASDFPFGSYDQLDVVAAPHLLEAVFRPDIVRAAADHLGCLPTLGVLQAWWNFPGHVENPVPGGYAPQFYHRDLNDLRMFWIYIYLTDVDESAGPHQVIRGSSDPVVIGDAMAGSAIPVDDFFYQYGYQLPPDLVATRFADREETFLGLGGTTFFTNGFNFHRIHYPLAKPRLMFAARFSINPSVYRGPKRHADPIPGEVFTERLGDTPSVRYITRKVADWRPRQPYFRNPSPAVASAS